MNLLYVAIGGALGSVLRYVMQNLIGHHLGKEFPYGTMLINISGSVIMGLFIGWLARATPQSEPAVRLFFAVGVLGGYTTFSSFSLDAITLMREGQVAAMMVYILLSVVFSLIGLLAGLSLMRSLA